MGARFHTQIHSPQKGDHLPIGSANLQTRHGDQRQQGGADPEADDHFHFVVAGKKVVVVERAASQQTLAGQLEPAYLGDDAQRLDDEHAPDDHQQELLLGDQCG
jgi:hypothetical protein